MEELKKLIRSHPMSSRWEKLCTYLQNIQKNVDGLFICDGEDDLDSMKIKILAVQSYLFRFEFINSAIVILPHRIIFFSNRQKANLMKEFPLKNGQILMDVPFSDKEPSATDFESFFGRLQKLGVEKLGYFEKEKPKGFLGDPFMKKMRSAVHLEDVSKEVQEFLSVKETEELHLIRGSAKLTCSFFRKLVQEVEEVIDNGDNVLHSVISNKVDNFMEKAKQKPNKWKLNGSFYDFAYAPMIQSNKTYSLKLTSGNAKENLSSDCILLNLCGKYHEMNCLIVRSLLVNPKQEDKRNYGAVKYLHEKIISNLKTGDKLNMVYEKSRNSFTKRYPHLKDHLPSSFGFGMGYEYKERCLNISMKNKRVVKVNQVFAIVSSLNNLKGFKTNKDYALQLADTVIIKEDGVEVITKKVSKNIEEIGYDFEEESDEENIKTVKERKAPEHDNYMEQKLQLLQQESHKLSGKRITRAALQREKIMKDNQRQREREKHQKKLLDLKMKEIEQRYNEGTFIQQGDKDKKMVVTDISLYNNINFPSNLKLNEARTDVKKWAILLPINDRVVPFHICLLKNVVKQSDGEYSRIRFNFFHPGIAVSTLEFPQSTELPEKTLYLQELAYRSNNHDSISSLTKRIKELKKKWTLRRDILEEDRKRIELGDRLTILHDLKMRPAVSGKKSKGTLYAYTKGYRFVTKKNMVFEVAHSNIKHAIFQPCDENMMIILHFRLSKAVEVNKKRVHDVQFYCEVGSIAEDLNDPRRHRSRFDYPNEMEEEEMERYMQQKYNDAFLTFVETVNKKAHNAIEFESPFTEFSFYGSPYYNNVLISPCDRCLVSIVDIPLFVLSLDEIEIVSIERIDNKIKNFDLIIIFKDYSRNVQSISNIPKSNLDKIRSWLDSKNILFFEGGKINLKWDNILKKIRENAKEFIFEDGGWRGFFEDDEEQSVLANQDIDEESSFNEEDFDEEEDDPYQDDEFLDNLDEEDEEEEEEEEYYDEEEDIITDEDDQEVIVKKKNKKKKRRR